MRAIRFTTDPAALVAVASAAMLARQPVAVALPAALVCALAIKPMPTLAEVSKLIKSAQNRAALDAAKTAAALLPSASREQARVIYAERIAEIKAMR